MNRDKYLTELGSYLAILPMDRKTKILEFYNEHTAKLVANGEDLIEKLGPPRELAGNIYRYGNGHKISSSSTKGQKKTSFTKNYFCNNRFIYSCFCGIFCFAWTFRTCPLLG